MKKNYLGSRNNVTTDPRHIKEIFNEMLRSNLPLAKGFRSHMASKENNAEKGVIENE